MSIQFHRPEEARGVWEILLPQNPATRDVTHMRMGEDLAMLTKGEQYLEEW